jgi:aminoglycoside phosphotransferase
LEKIREVIEILVNKGLLSKDDWELKRLKSGTTDGILFTLSLNQKPAYVIKIDRPAIIASTHDFLLTYQQVKLLPDVLYTDNNKEFIVYSFIDGETHVNCGSKLDWLKVLVNDLFNQYQRAADDVPWGRVNGIERTTWSDFNESSFESAKENIDDLLLPEDHQKVRLLLSQLKADYAHEEKYYLHGDTGVHNFVFLDGIINGVIDPSPLIGPRIYDFTYAFCSSPDSLDMSTLLASFSLWSGHESFTKDRLVNEVLFQLYTRIGVCMKVHPQDLNGYMNAWEYWRNHLPQI